MDEDVKLNLEQAQEKWLIRRAVAVALAFFLLVGFWVHDCNQIDLNKPCTDATFDPNKYDSIKCPDPRQTLTYPPGWTWAMCSCPSKQ